MITAVHTLVYALAARGAEFAGGVSEARFGRTARLRVPGAGEMLLYQPAHPVAYDLAP